MWIIVANGKWERLAEASAGPVPVALQIDSATFEKLQAGEIDVFSEELRIVAERMIPIPDAVACAVFTHDLIERAKALR